ncbi:MAG: hypothetical protein LQ350_008114 [Teloschistes chrysophthalmus]|nr:MAG: hypothetical protein LQ350_008114 [Niorma chrysophthalma]
MDDPSKRSNGLKRDDIFVARMSEALARASTNDVYLVYGQEVGGGGKDGDVGGIYQLALDVDPKDPNLSKLVPNAWRTWEFPTVQKYSEVQKIYGVDKSKGFPLTNVEWTRNTGQKEMPDSYASELELPPLAGNSAKFRRDTASACPGAAATTSGSKSTSSLAPKPTLNPGAPQCTYVAPEPPITPQAYCTCDGAATVEAGSSAVNVGTLTSDALYTSVSKALASICPPATQTTDFTHCSTDVATVKGITYVADGTLLTDGKFVVQVKSSQYNLTSLRDALIKSAATTAKFSTSDKNSYVAHYTFLEKRRWWHNSANLAKRALGLKIRDHPVLEHEQKTLYRAVDFAGAHYYSPFINVNNIDKGTDYIDVAYSFQAGASADVNCDFIEALVDGLAIIAPEFAVEDIELGSAIEFVCREEGDNEKRDMSPNPWYIRHVPLRVRDEV